MAEPHSVNINYEIPEELHRALKVKAAEEGKTLKQVIIEAFRLYLGGDW